MSKWTASDLASAVFFAANPLAFEVQDCALFKNAYLQIQSFAKMNLKERSLADSMSGQKILVIDDVPFNRLLPGLILRPFGAEVLECSDVHEACALLSQQSIHWIFLDISMPGIDGIESLAILKSHVLSVRAPPKIYAYTAYAAGEKADELLALGFDGIVHKPVKNQTLVDIFIKNK